MGSAEASANGRSAARAGGARRYRAAACQFEPLLLDKEANLARLCDAFPRPWVDFQRTYALARAMENSVYVVLANYLGRVRTFDFFGGSIIVDPYGRVLAEAGTEEAVLVAEVDLDVVARARTELGYLAGRRPELYAEWGGQ